MAAKKTAPAQDAPPPQPGTDAESSLSFEQAVRRLGEIVEHLEAGELPLEQSLELFEQGVRLSRQAQTKLDAAEKRVEQLLGYDENGRPLVKSMDGEPPDER